VNRTDLSSTKIFTQNENAGPVFLFGVRCIGFGQDGKSIPAEGQYRNTLMHFFPGTILHSGLAMAL